MHAFARRTLIASSFGLLLAAATSAGTAQTAPLALSRTIELTGVSGRYDHFAVDPASNRLFAAVPGNHSIEIVDLASGKIVQSITGLGKPHGLAFIDDALYASDGSLADLRVYKGSPLALAGTIKLSEDADDMVYDAAHHLLFVGHGTGEAAAPARVAVVDTQKFELVANLAVSAHPEALEIDPATHRVFVNIEDTSEIAVIDTEKRSIAATWKLTKAAANVPLGLDEKRKLLYVACRKPASLLVLDANTGKELSSAPSAPGVDDLFYDAALSRIYVIGGGGEVHAHQVGPAGDLAALSVVKTAQGAKTGLFVPAQNALYIGVPGTAPGASTIRVYTPAK